MGIQGEALSLAEERSEPQYLVVADLATGRIVVTPDDGSHDDPEPEPEITHAPDEGSKAAGLIKASPPYSAFVNYGCICKDDGCMWVGSTAIEQYVRPPL